MDIYFYNTLTRKKELFKSIDGKEVKIYSCGPTVYSYAHIGNFRRYVFDDTLKRTLIYNGYKLNDVMNITDVGHLTSDADTGEDKMEKAAKKEGKDPYEIARFYTDAFMKDFNALNIIRPKVITKATDNINEMLEMVKEIIKNGYGYETSKGIYFDVSKLDKYPVLSNNDVLNQEAGARVEVDKEKRNPYDFALWIKAPKNHIMKWDSPWGPSYPGWHLECSTMGRRFLGENFDIHTGGVDHIPVHHENEIAQCVGSFGHNPAKFWMHCEFLLVDGGKMSKSLGNIYTISELEEKGYEPLAYKLFCFSSHYRNKLNFTFEGLDGAQKSLNRLRSSYKAHFQGTDILNNEDKDKLVNIENNFHKAINDDLNMPLAMSFVWEAAKFNKKSKEVANLLKKFDSVLGLSIDKENKKEDIPEEILKLVNDRNEARKNKDYNKSDELRNLILKKGYIIKDTKDGVQIEKNK